MDDGCVWLEVAVEVAFEQVTSEGGVVKFADSVRSAHYKRVS